MTDQIKIGENGVTLYQAIAVKHGLKALTKGFLVNSAYTSTNCRRMATKFTGKKYPAGKNGLEAAYNDMVAVIEDAAPAVREAGNISHG